MSHVSGQQRGMSRAIGTRWVAKLDDMSYPVTVRNHNNGLKITFENKSVFGLFRKNFIKIGKTKIGPNHLRVFTKFTNVS